MNESKSNFTLLKEAVMEMVNTRVDYNRLNNLVMDYLDVEDLADMVVSNINYHSIAESVSDSAIEFLTDRLSDEIMDDLVSTIEFDYENEFLYDFVRSR